MFGHLGLVFTISIIPVQDLNVLNVMNCSFPLSPFHYFISFLLLSFLFIAWESLSHSVT